MDNEINSFDAILGTAIDKPAMRFHFYQAFLELELIVLGTAADIKPSQDDGGPSLFLKYLEMENELFLPVYSSMEKFRTIFPSNYHYVRIQSRDLLSLIEYFTVDVFLLSNISFYKKSIPYQYL